MSDVPPVERRRISRLQWIGISAFLGLTIWLGVWLIGAIHDAREAALKSACSGRFCQITVALHNYHDTYGSLPPAYVNGPDGTPWHSWRTLLLPFLDQSAIYNEYRFDEPWNSPHNQQLGETRERRYWQCPSSPGYETSPFTNYVVVVGEQTAFPGTATTSFEDMTNPEEVMLFVEVEGLDIHWMEPRDLELDTMSFEINSATGPSISSSHPGGAHVRTVGGGCSGIFWTSGLTESHLRRLLTFQKRTQDEPSDE